mgnify:CR=1 FL=1
MSRRAASHPPGHGRRRPGRVHRRRASHGGAARRPLRAGRGCAVVRRGTRGGERGRAAHRRRAQLRRLPRHGARREAAREDGIDVVAIVTPNHLHGRIATRISRRRHRRDLRQAADHHAGRGARRWCSACAAAAACSRSRTTTAAIRWCARRARWWQPASSARSAWCTPSTRRTGSAPISNRPGRSRPRGVSIRRSAGAGGSLGDIGTHAEHLARFISGLELAPVSADLTTFVAGRRLDDNCPCAAALHERRARHAVVEPGRARQRERAARARLRQQGRASSSRQEHPNQLWFTPLGQPPAADHPRRQRCRRAAARATTHPCRPSRGLPRRLSPSSTATWPSRSRRAGNSARPTRWPARCRPWKTARAA